MNSAKAFATNVAKALVTGEPRVAERILGFRILSCRGVALKKLLLFHHFSSRLLDCFEFCFSCESRSCAVCTFSPLMVLLRPRRAAVHGILEVGKDGLFPSMLECSLVRGQ